MHCDFNVSENFSSTEIQELNNSQYDRIALTKTISLTDYNFETTPKQLNLQKKFYRKINLDFAKEKITPATLKKLTNYDIICLRLFDYQDLKYAIDLSPDLLSFDFTSASLRLRPGFIRDAINRGIFFEIVLVDCLYGNCKEWLRNVIDLIGITKGRGLIVSSGATVGTELKSVEDVFLFLRSFGVSEKRCFDVLSGNCIKLLESCALKRFSFRGVVANDEKKGVLKDDFILCKFSM
ncbi:hypothetical protein COBT_001895 [Conglomerata obtusa]